MTLDDARHDLSFDYDALGAAPLTSQDFSYDANGNRLSFTEGAGYAYTVTPNSNRVATVAGPTPKTYTYDAAGNIVNDGSTAYTYDDRGRLVTAGTATYTYNGLGQRVKKDNGTVTLFAYDEQGHLIGEYDALGNPVREHVWFDGAPVAVIVGSDVHYVHTDHLGTPRAITDTGTVIWRWESDPFGSTAAQEDPDGDLVDFTYNLRFPGQYYDSESGLHYNYFRTYDPSTGRYLESDPSGLFGGENTYTYVDSDPLTYFDPFGLSRNRNRGGLYNPYSPNSYPPKGSRHGVPPLRGLSAIQNPSIRLNPNNGAARHIVESAIANARNGHFSFERMDADVALAGLQALEEYAKRQRERSLLGDLLYETVKDERAAEKLWNDMIDAAEKCASPSLLRRAKASLLPWDPLN